MELLLTPPLPPVDQTVAKTRWDQLVVNLELLTRVIVAVLTPLLRCDWEWIFNQRIHCIRFFFLPSWLRLRVYLEGSQTDLLSINEQLTGRPHFRVIAKRLWLIHIPPPSIILWPQSINNLSAKYHQQLPLQLSSTRRGVVRDLLIIPRSANFDDRIKDLSICT